MVFFTCNGCGEAVRKQQVEKHRLRCRRSHVFSCMDCGADFRGIEYNGHTKCVSEREKYSGGTYQEKEAKGEVKQQSWTDQVQKAIDQAKPTHVGLRKLLESLKSYTNIPRKQAKFKKFLSNSLGIRNEGLIDDAWEAISASAKDAQPSDGHNTEHIDSQPTEQQENNKRPLQEKIETTSEKKRQKVEEKNEKEEEKLATIEANGHSGKKSRKCLSNSASLRDDNLANSESSATFTTAKDDEVPSDDHSKSTGQEEVEKEKVEENNEHKENLAVTETSNARKLKKKMFKAAVKNILTETAEGRMKLKKLRKAIVKTLSTDNVSEEDVLARIDHLLPKCKQFVVDGKYISIAS
ncbi:cell growth regulating nucleolar protein [Trichuris trichiura]|uniref:Cell growth regulating nucleolar protein n=1 Tax=Trichuris trichiura TaxID=36087 RepID=A0A077Z672_TRITR|nr:cell growth regulating nucleolar protein [Trichuris trichiura]